MAELGLEEHGDTLVGSLSGGQRKRVGVGCELVHRPGLVFLDEPTTGLDPALERRSMELFRRLADASRTVTLVTHATRSLALCDLVVVMGRGGHLRFAGPPSTALTYFGVEDYDDIYRALERGLDTGPPHEPDGNRAAASTALLDVGPEPVVTGPPPRRAIPQLRMLTSKERAVLERERAVGLRLHAYLGSKLAVLWALATVQSIALMAIVLALRDPPRAASLLSTAILLVVTAWIAVTMGLLVSALARSEDQATSFIPLVLLPQLLFAGAIVPVRDLSPALDAVAHGVFARWSFAGTGSAMDLERLLSTDRIAARADRYGSFFALELGPALAILAGFIVVFAGAVAWALRERS